MSSLKKTVVIVCGPTAVGKTSVAISIARHFSTEIISADSRQCFEELRIGVARPSEKELEDVRHHFIATHSIQENINAAFFEEYAIQKVKELFREHEVVVMVGGTGLYIKAFSEGLDEIPSIAGPIRTGIIERYNKEGVNWLQNEIREKDPKFYLVGEMQNPQRMMRALEVVQSTGRSILDFRNATKAKRDFAIIRIGLNLPKEELDKRIHSRVDKMIEHGLVEEVESLVSLKHLNALQTVGYTEIFEFLSGKITLETAIAEIKKNTRHYAKRQMTWFRKDKEIKWFSPKEIGSIINEIEAGFC